MTIDHRGQEFGVKGGLWHGELRYDRYQWAGTPREWHEAPFAKGRELGPAVFSPPFNSSVVDFPEDLDTPVYKIAYFKAVGLPLIAKAVATGKPMILSTGMADLGEVTEVVDGVPRNGVGGLILQHCVAAYSAPAEESKLHTIRKLAETYHIVAGLSDRVLGSRRPSPRRRWGRQ